MAGTNGRYSTWTDSDELEFRVRCKQCGFPDDLKRLILETPGDAAILAMRDAAIAALRDMTGKKDLGSESVA